MAWKETSQGFYQRPLGVSEKIMVSVIESENPVSREPIQIRSVADFIAPYPSTTVVLALKDAWKALRLLKSPDIATTFGDGNKYYKVPSSQELEEWQTHTFIIAETGTSVQTAVREMQLRSEILPVCYLLPQSTQDGNFKGSIVLFISHWRTEASGSFKILNQLFAFASDLLTTNSNTQEAFSNHIFGSETHLLTPALEDILMPNQRSTAKAKTRVETHFAKYYSKLPCIDIPIQSFASTVPSHVKLCTRTYTPASTSCLVSACKAKGISVTSAVHSAYLGAVWHIADPSKRNRSYACMMPAQVRKRLPTTSPFREQGCWIAQQMLMLTAPTGQDFLTRARGLREQYKLADQEKWLHKDTREVSERTLELITAGSWFKENDASAATHSEPIAVPGFTSIGILDRDIIVPENNGIRVDNVAFWVDTIGPGPVLAMWTFRGRLTIQFFWDAAYHGDGQIKELIDIVTKTLLVESGAHMTIEEIKIAEG